MRARLSGVRHLLVVPVLLMLASVSSAGEIRYIYDDLDRLIGVIDPTGNSAQYTYDAVGNLTSIVQRIPSQVSIMEVSPSSGPVGATVTLYGTGFSPTPSQNTVTFTASKGKRPTATVTAATANELTTTVPSNAATGTIIVTTPNGTATSGVFTVTTDTGAPTISSFTPSIATAGTAITITGTNFDPVAANDKLKVNRSLTAATSATATSIGMSTPRGTGSGHVTVSTSAGTAVSSADLFIPPTDYTGYTAAAVQVTGRISVGGAGKVVSLTATQKLGLVVFDGTAGERVTVNISNVTFPSTTVTLYDPFAATVTGTTVGTSGGSFPAQLPIDGTYTLAVPSRTNTGSLTLTVAELADVTGTITIGGPPLLFFALPRLICLRITSRPIILSANFARECYQLQLWV